MQIKDFILKPGIIMLAFLAFSSFTKILHPYYISVTEIRLNSEQKTVSLSCKMFTDDLQIALNKLYNSRVELMKKNSQCDSLINRYVNEHLEVIVGSKKVDFMFLGYEIEEEATWCYFESTLHSDEKYVKVKTSVLYDFIESQTNFLHCYYNKERKSFKLENPDQLAEFTFKN